MADKLVFKNAPLTGGNTRQTYIDMEIQVKKDLSNLNQIHLALKENIDTHFKECNYDEWRLLNFQADYFCNVFPIITDSIEMNEMIQLAKRIAFLYGESAIMRDEYTDKLVVVYIKKIERSYTGTMLSAAVAPGLSVLSKNLVKPNPSQGWNLKGERLSEKNFAYFRWDTLGWGAWYKFWPFIKQQDKLLKILGTDAYSYIKKFAYKVKDQSASKQEIDAYFNPANPFLIVSDFDDDFGNRFHTMETKANATSMSLFDYYKFWEKTYYELLGRRLNTDAKRERNITNEVLASQNNFDVLENDNYIHTVNFIKRLERMTGIQIRVADNEITGEEIAEEVEDDI